MRRLSEERTKLVFAKLTKYIGDNLQRLIDRPDSVYCLREQKNRVYYMSEKILVLAETVSIDSLISAGTCIGKFTKTGKFLLHITALNLIVPYAQNKMWLKSTAEQQFLYGNNITKAGLGRITENVSQYEGVVIFSFNDLPLGFGVASKNTFDCKAADPMAVVCYHQADIGEYVRSENSLL
ncbi:60S ribosome subunit biogenesis protein NIP7 homolog [Copidosoma floridanum]|uniref:60S ribosome subunit biogenesis protein NIP7 homolog n=1 Tax=Copidosoma floridanum TaxID=29053 RepID=UPI0006C9701C|nr:60S ribosome subunit biogenesis protein NIP7 homolog [Copidosoma floridanum]